MSPLFVLKQTDYLNEDFANFSFTELYKIKKYKFYYKALLECKIFVIHYIVLSSKTVFLNLYIIN